MKKIRFLLATFSLMLGSVLFAQPVTITGTVTDGTDGMPMIGVTVVIKGTTEMV
ncbi:MAG: hypothetical protein PHV46_06315 [Bacteroidales bacterium]|jgi:hypothetical protein|nr:hypothetical protein [Bacteroidales bacterium]MDD4058710.1 hypothetical protein [Bacteroidales bacterium]